MPWNHGRASEAAYIQPVTLFARPRARYTTASRRRDSLASTDSRARSAVGRGVRGAILQQQ